MIKTIDISSISDVTTLLLDQEYNPDIDRFRSPFLFHGTVDASYKLQPSLKTNCGQKMHALESGILDNFSKYAVNSIPDIDSSVWKKMVVGQHYGLPTRLLDWSHSALIALHFATAEKRFADTDKRDGVVWRVDPRELNRLLPEKYRKIIEKQDTAFFSVSTLSKAANSISAYDRDMKGQAMALLEPPSLDQRIINQYAYFSIIPKGMDDIEDFFEKNTSSTIRYIIHKEIRWDIRDLLDQYNISERVIYPGLDGLSLWIARHYFVKDQV